MGKDFSNIKLKISYDSGTDDILWDFYIPVLSIANQYDRIAGFFSSTSLAFAARGMETFIANGGKMRLVTCPMLTSKDIDIINKAQNTIDEIILKNFIKDYDEIEEKFKKDHVKALGWMIAEKKLEIKIAVPKKDGKICNEEEIIKSGIMHQKVGILYDRNGNTISFSGSNNESASGWIGNTEEFKVFNSWEGGNNYIAEDKKKFSSFWDGTRTDMEVSELPNALEKMLIKEGKGFEPEQLNVRKYYCSKIRKKKEPLKLFFYQQEAVDKWLANNRKLLLQMATGCGKTRTALGCMKKAIEDTQKLLIVIACPQVPLCSQWKKDIDKLDVNVNHSIVLNGTISHWQDILKTEILKLSTGRYKHLVVYTTHDICCSNKFTKIILNSNEHITKFMIGDEVHGLGASKTKDGLLDTYEFRLGLSATPQRWFDDEGSKIIEEYFGNNTYEFSIDDALKNHNPLTGKSFLVNYEYHPVFVHLNEDELEKYKLLTKKIAKSYGNKEKTFEDLLKLMRMNRAKIEKNAEEKYEMLEEILDRIGTEISDTIIFVTDAQIDRVMHILGDRAISASRFTQDQKTISQSKYNGLSEREYIIKLFKEKKYQVLVAIKCLDEGIDIPSAQCGIVMASSTNPREYIQRIGRIIRQAPDKSRAHLYDMIICPAFARDDGEMTTKLEKKIFEKEMNRAVDLAQCAINNSTEINKLYERLWEVTQ